MRIAAPHPSFRLIPSKFPPIGLFDTVTRAADLEAVMELAGWTNDRLVAGRIDRLPPSEWAYGRPNSSIVMAAFLHAAPQGGRFNGPDLGAWYAAADIATAAAEVGHHLRREAVARDVPELNRSYRTYTARLAGAYEDIRGTNPAVHAPDDYSAGQAVGEAERQSGGDGFVYGSVRYGGGTNVVAYRPSKVLEVTQAQHYEISVSTGERRIEVTALPDK